MRNWIILSLLVCGSLPLLALGPKHVRDCSILSQEEKEFAEQLTVHNRKFFCGRFNAEQRRTAMDYSENGIPLTQSQAYLLTPDEAVQRVKEESGMPMSVKRQRECEEE